MVTSDKLIDEGRVWARLDGCEGGDFLNVLGDALEMVHYSYAKEPLAEKLLQEAISLEIEAHKAMALGVDPESYGYDPKEVAEALKELGQ